MSNKTLMVLGAGVFQLPAIRAASKLGYRTVAVSYYESDPGRAEADEFILCSTVDRDAVLEHARRLRIDGITTMASEVSAVTAAYVAGALGLPGYDFETARSIGNKVLLRRFLKKHGFPAPGFYGVKTLEEAERRFQELRKPVFLKPASASGSRGAFKVNTVEELRDCFARSVSASILDAEVILEENLEGREIGGEVLVKDGRIVFFKPTWKLLNSRFVPYGHILPVDLEEPDFRAVKEMMAAVVEALGLRNGPLNFDVMMTADGPVIIELGGRLGGNCLPELMRLHTGVNTVDAVVRLAMGESFELPPLQENPVGVFIFGAAQAGTVERVNRLEERFPEWSRDVVRARIDVEIGQSVEPFIQGDRQLGYYIMKAADGKTLAERAKRMQQEEWVKVA